MTLVCELCGGPAPDPHDDHRDGCPNQAGGPTYRDIDCDCHIPACPACCRTCRNAKENT